MNVADNPGDVEDKNGGIVVKSSEIGDIAGGMTCRD
jgi:hypothetical protein